MSSTGRAVLGLVLTAGLAALSPQGVAVAAAPATSTTVIVRDMVFVEYRPDACLRELGTLTETVDYIVHTTTGPGISQSHALVSSDFSFDYDDPTLPTYTGQYTYTSNAVENAGVTVMTVGLNFPGLGSDGSRLNFHRNLVLVVSTDGTVRVDVSNVFCDVR